MALIQIDVEHAASIVSDKIGALMKTMFEESAAKAAQLSEARESQALTAIQESWAATQDKFFAKAEAQMEAWRAEVRAFKDSLDQYEFRAGLVKKGNTNK